MKKNIKLPTILGVIILVFGMIAGIYLINSTQIFKISADVEAIPKNVRITNIIDSSLTVSWTTDIESNGFVKWGTNQTILSKVALEENSDKSFVHSANIIGLEKDSDIFFKISSNGKDYDNSGTIWQTKTSSIKVLQGEPLIASGSVLMQDGKSPAKAIVYLSINGDILSSITSDGGTFIIPVSTFVGEITDKNLIEITVNGGVNGTSQAVIYPVAIKSIPTMIIGKTYDFRSIVIDDSIDLPKSSLTVPESVEMSSRFEVTKTEPTTNTNVITIDSINDGEIITTTDPEFFGKGPKGTSLTITVESELQETALVVDSKGAWNWSPPNNLESGEHKVTIKWNDANGIVRSLTRSFIVQASEGPAFESTPSATPENSVSPSASPKSTKTPTATAPATPETGSLIPTLGLFMMGIGILFSSVYIWNKQDVY